MSTEKGLSLNSAEDDVATGSQGKAGEVDFGFAVDEDLEFTCKGATEFSRCTCAMSRQGQMGLPLA
jgi:hypothetical protein